MSALVCAGCNMSDESTEKQIRNEVNQFLIKQVELSGLSLEAKSDLLRLVLLVQAKETKGSESNERFTDGR